MHYRLFFTNTIVLCQNWVNFFFSHTESGHCVRGAPSPSVCSRQDTPPPSGPRWWVISLGTTLVSSENVNGPSFQFAECKRTVPIVIPTFVVRSKCRVTNRVLSKRRFHSITNLNDRSQWDLLVGVYSGVAIDSNSELSFCTCWKWKKYFVYV